MKYRAHNAARDGNEREIVGILRSYGISVVLLDKPLDLLCGWRCITRLAEVKMPRNKKNEPKPYTSDQLEFLDTWQGDTPALLVTIDDAHDFANQMLLAGKGK